ncbi:unnamed protein product, partial [Leptidea sinapis]
MDLSPDEENIQGRLLHQIQSNCLESTESMAFKHTNVGGSIEFEAFLWHLTGLLGGGAEVGSKDEHNRTALHAAVLAERSMCLPALCNAGVDVNAVSDESTGGKTALHIAAECGNAENVKALLSAGADLAILTAGGDSAVALAERGRHRHAANLLREAR